LIPWDGGAICIRLHVHDFMSRCPVTKQPDFAELFFDYIPGDHIVETKSFKLWIQRLHGEALFNERIVNQFAMDFAKQVLPRTVTVRGVFARRGGIHVEAETTLEDVSRRVTVVP